MQQKHSAFSARCILFLFQRQAFELGIKRTTWANLPKTLAENLSLTLQALIGEQSEPEASAPGQALSLQRSVYFVPVSASGL